MTTVVAFMKKMENNQTVALGTVQITFVILRLRLKRKTLNAFYFQTDFNLRFKRKRDVRLTCERV